MRLHANLALPAVVDGAALEWVASPAAGVERRMFERDGEEVARATSLVRYAPGSSFSPHVHGAGEEFLVLDGVFSDENGDYPVGWYVRNPPGSRHAPASVPGAVIFVKLRQMPPEETRTLRLDTRDPCRWTSEEPAIERALLFDAPWERVEMLRLARGHRALRESWPGGIEWFVVDGAVTIDGIDHGSGAWLRFPPGTTVTLTTPDRALLYRKSGHLRRAPDPAPPAPPRSGLAPSSR